jgi:hypothetical protein
MGSAWAGFLIFTRPRKKFTTVLPSLHAVGTEALPENPRSYPTQAKTLEGAPSKLRLGGVFNAHPSQTETHRPPTDKPAQACPERSRMV